MEMKLARSRTVDSAEQQVFRKTASEIFVSSDLVNEVFANEQPAGYRQEDSRFPEISETYLNAMMQGNQNKNTKKSNTNMTQCI